MLKIEFSKIIGIISELLVINFEEHTVDEVQYKVVNSLTSFDAYTTCSFIYT